MHILIAPNAFKNSLDAATAAKAIGRGLLSGFPSCTTTRLPVGDGGDGTGKLLTEAGNGRFINHTVQDPLGRNIQASYGLIENKTAVIEMATASGIRLLKEDERDPLRASSFGTGQLIVHALNSGVNKILLCVGGSATVDGGCGILQALGVRFTDEQENEIKQMPSGLDALAAIDRSRLHPGLEHCELIILCDVTNPLLGEKGAAKVFGPQKGASPEQVIQLDHRLQQLQKIILNTSGTDIGSMPHGGAAGGVVAGLCALANAKAVNGTDYFLDSVSFDQALEHVDLIITGEGSLDLQTLEGKAPYGVAARARKKNIPVIALTGVMPVAGREMLSEYFQQIIPLNKENITLSEALASTEMNLETKAREIGLKIKYGL
jgi:glycerate kinase